MFSVRIRRWILATAATFGLSAAASADVIVMSGTIPTTGSNGGWCSPCDVDPADYRVFDLFTLVSGATITEAIVPIDPTTALAGFNVSVWDLTLTAPLFSQTFASGDYIATPITSDPSDDNVVLSFAIPGWTLGAGSYYLSLFGGSGDGVTGLQWVSDEGATPGDAIQIELPSGSVLARDRFVIYQLNGSSTVPEPGTLALVGLAALAMYRRRKR